MKVRSKRGRNDRHASHRPEEAASFTHGRAAMSKIEFTNMTVSLSESTFSPQGAQQNLTTATIKSTVINATQNSTCTITSDLVEIYSLDATVIGNSMFTIGGSDDTAIMDNGHAKFTIFSEGPSDASSIEINGLDLLNDKYTKDSLEFNFDTSAGPNFGAFNIPGNGNAFVVNHIFSEGLVCVDDKSVTFDERRFKTDYINNNLTLSLRNGK
jgi:hypothetical protein